MVASLVSLAEKHRLRNSEKDELQLYYAPGKVYVTHVRGIFGNCRKTRFGR